MNERDCILLAEEDSEAAFITQLAFKKARISNPIHVVNSHRGVVSYLSGKGPYRDRETYPLPSIVILALRAPLMNGFGTLRWIRHHAEFDGVNVAVLAGVGFQNEKEFALDLGADWYGVKPCEFNLLVAMAERLGSEWLGLDRVQEAA